MIAALHNLRHFYSTIGLTEHATRVDNHIQCIREMHNRGTFGTNHAVMINFDQAVRDHRCRQKQQGDWSLSNDMNHPEQLILRNHITQHMGQLGNSSAPEKDPSGAPGERSKTCPKFKRTGKCTKHEAGECPFKHPEHLKQKGDASRKIPSIFFNKCKEISPAICVQFAYFGSCQRNPGGDSCTINGATYRHVCSKCQFKNGSHSISKGTGC